MNLLRLTKSDIRGTIDSVKGVFSMNGKIYIIKNTVNEKCYIGQTVQKLNKRFTQHKRLSEVCSNQLIYKAIKKYGAEKFYIELIEDGISSPDELNKKEVEYIKKYNTLKPNGYNLCPGGALWRRKPKIEDSEISAIKDMYLNKNMSLREIGEIYNINHHSVSAFLEKNGIPRRKRSCKLPDRTSILTKDVMIECYINRRMKIKDIASEYDVDVKTVNRAKRRYNLKRI